MLLLASDPQVLQTNGGRFYEATKVIYLRLRTGYFTDIMYLLFYKMIEFLRRSESLI